MSFNSGHLMAQGSELNFCPLPDFDEKFKEMDKTPNFLFPNFDSDLSRTKKVSGINTSNGSIFLRQRFNQGTMDSKLSKATFVPSKNATGRLRDDSIEENKRLQDSLTIVKTKRPAIIISLDKTKKRRNINKTGKNFLLFRVFSSTKLPRITRTSLKRVTSTWRTRSDKKFDQPAPKPPIPPQLPTRDQMFVDRTAVDSSRQTKTPPSLHMPKGREKAVTKSSEAIEQRSQPAKKLQKKPDPYKKSKRSKRRGKRGTGRSEVSKKTYTATPYDGTKNRDDSYRFSRLGDSYDDAEKRKLSYLFQKNPFPSIKMIGKRNRGLSIDPKTENKSFGSEPDPENRREGKKKITVRERTETNALRISL
eukprot:augustus_masked-scaffold_1-processed-gene-20.10-mRNA-1 protein AED:1.00 eAED:1.00 QI:0/-1/0/0/-1/1/1/0/362